MEIKLREDIKEADKWNLESLYRDYNDFEEDFLKVKSNVNKLLDYKGKLNDGEELLKCLKLYENLYRIIDKLIIYSSHKFDENTTNQEFNAMYGKIKNYYSVFLSITSFIEVEIMDLSIEKFIINLRNIPELMDYKHFVESIIRKKEHTLDENGERILASLDNCLGVSQNVYSLLTNADMRFPNIVDENGNDIELSNSTYKKYMISENRDVRRSVYLAITKTFKSYENTFAELLSNNVNSFVTKSKIRKYNSSLEYALNQNNIPVSVFTEALKVYNENTKSLHRYYKLKKKYLGLQEVHNYDASIKIIDIPDVYIEFDEAVKTVTKALQPLGDEYINIFKKGIEERWIDKFPCKGKKSGAYSLCCYDSIPFVLLNYNGTFNDMSTLAHEMGHSLHAYYTNKNQPYFNSRIPSFLAEIASITNEILLSEYLIANEKDTNTKRYFINKRLEHIEMAAFLQLKFSDFELYIHKRLEDGNTLTANELSEYWHRLDENFFGNDVIVDDEGSITWARIPHFYEDYYVYQYATGYAAANMFASKILNNVEGISGSQGYCEKYIDFLKNGNSDYPIETLKKYGIDMTTRFPLENVVDTFNRLLDELERL